MPRIRVEIVGDPSSAVKAFKTTERQAEHLGRELRRADRDMQRFGRGMVAGSGVLGGLGRSVAFASSTFLGGAGLIYAFRKVTQEARLAQTTQVRVAQAVRNSGNEWARHKRQIDSVIQAQSRLAAFDDEELLDTFGHLVTRTRDVNRALELNALAANVARGRNMGLEASSRLVLKASMGNVGALRRLGINLDKNATATQILAALQQRYAGQAVKFGKTSAGAQERWNKTLEDSEEIIGRALLPTIDKLLRKGTDWLDQQNRTGNLQRNINKVVEDGGKIMEDVAEAIGHVKDTVEPVIKLVGGLGNAIKIAGGLWIAFKIKALMGIGATVLASAGMRTKMVADAAMIGAALDTATRPRFVQITPVMGPMPFIPGGGPGGGRPGPTTAPGRFGRGKPSLPDRINQYGNKPTPTTPRAPSGFGVGGWALVVASIVGSQFLDFGGGPDKMTQVDDWEGLKEATAAGVITRDGITALLERKLISKGQARELRAIERRRRTFTPGPNATVPTQAPFGGGKAPRPKKPKTPRGGGGGGGGGGLRSRGDITTSILAARAYGDEAAEMGFLREEKSKINAQIRSLKRRGELTKKEEDQLNQLYSDLAGTNAAISALVQANATKVKAANDKAADAQKKAADAQKKAAEAARLAAEKLQQQWQNARQQASQAFSGLFTGPILGGGFGDFIRQYGQQGAKIDPTLILQDIRMQNTQTAGLLRNLQTLAKRGMPVGVMNQLREMGPEGAGFIASLANAPKAVFDAVVKALGVRQQQLEKATIFIQARNVTVKSGAAADVEGDKPDPGLKRAGGGTVPGTGSGDTVPAMLTPGELVLNRMQQGGLARAMGMPGASPQALFGTIDRMATGGVAMNVAPGAQLQPPFGMTRRGPRRYSVHGSSGRFAPMRPNIGGWLDDFYGRGLSPAAGRRIGGWWTDNFSRIAQGYAGGGVVDRFNRWASGHKPQVDVLSSLGEWLGRPAETRGGRYARAQTKMFGETIIPTPAGMKAMGLFARDLGLGYSPPFALLRGDDAEAMRGRANTGLVAMARQMITALRHPIANAGLLAGMLVPLPSPGKLSGPTRALAKLKADITRTGSKYPTDLQPANLRIPREKLGRGDKPFDRKGGMLTARQIYGAAIASQKAGGKATLPAGVNSPADLLELMQDMYHAARAGKKERSWYKRSGRAILDYSGGDMGKAHKLAKLAALYSPQVSVEESIRVAVRAWEEFQRTGKVGPKGIPGDFRSAVIDGKRQKVPNLKQREDAMKILSGASGFELGGRKVGNFYTDLMREIDPGWIRRQMRAGKLGKQSATMDVWMMKAFGYLPKLNNKGKYKVDAPTDAQYDFMEMVNAAVGGQLGWRPSEVQAAVWSTTKARHEGRPVNQAGFDFGDYFARQSTQINMEAAWGVLGQKIQRKLGSDAAREYMLEKTALVEGVFGRMGILGKMGSEQQGVWGLELNPGMSAFMLAPRLAEKKQDFRMMTQFNKRAREAQAAMGYILHQDGMGSLVPFPSKTAAGTLNTNVKAGNNALWLTRKMGKGELQRMARKLGEELIMLPRGGGWIVKSTDNRVSAESLLGRVRNLGVRQKFDFETAPSGYVDSSEYMDLLARAEKTNPGVTAWVLGQRQKGDAIDARWRARMGDMMSRATSRAGGGMIPGMGSSDTVPAMLTPGEMVLNRRQQAGVSAALGLGRRTGSALFGEIQHLQGGGILSSGRARSASSFLPGSSSAAAQTPTFQQVNTITVPPEFADTKWAIERGLKSATWRLAKGI